MLTTWDATVHGAEKYGVNVLQYHMMRYMPEVFSKEASANHDPMSLLICDLSREKVAIEGHRGLAKSVFLSRGMASMIPTIRNADGSYRFDKLFVFTQSGGVGSLAVQWMAKFQDLVTGSHDGALVYQGDFGFRKGGTWTQDFCQVLRPDGSVFELSVRGKHGSVRGARNPKAFIILDDIQDVEDQKSEAILAHDEDWFIQDIYPILMLGQYARIIGQNLSPASLMARIEQMPSFEYYRFPLEAPVGSGKSTWEAEYPETRIDVMKQDMGLDRFNAEYNCIPMVSGNPIFRKEWFKTYDSQSEQWQRIKNSHLYTVSGFDGADSKSDAACETALVTFSATPDPDPDVYLREVFHGHVSLKAAVGMMFSRARDIDTHCTVVETRVKEGNMGPYEEEIRAQEQILRESINAEYVRPVHDKVTRALYVQSMVQRGKVYYDPNIKEHVDFVTQLCMFTGTQKFPADMVDAGDSALAKIKDYASRAFEAVSISSGQDGNW